MSGKGELRGRLAGLLPVGGGASAGRTPFVLLVVVLLGGGLIGLLVLNSALSEGAFRMDDLQRETKSLTDEQQALQRDIDAYSAPDALQKRARELGMVPGGDPAFLAPDGTVKGVPSPAAQPSGAHAQEAVRPPEAITLSQTNQGQPGQSQPGRAGQTTNQPGQASQPGQTTPSGQTSQSAPIGQPGRSAQPGQAGQPLGRPDQSATQQDLTTGQRTPQTPSAGTPAPSTPGR